MRYQIVGCACPCGGFTFWDLTADAANPFYVALRPDGTGSAYRTTRPRPCNVAYAVPLPIVMSLVDTAIPSGERLAEVAT